MQNDEKPWGLFDPLNKAWIGNAKGVILFKSSPEDRDEDVMPARIRAEMMAFILNLCSCPTCKLFPIEVQPYDGSEKIRLLAERGREMTKNYNS